MIDGNLTALFQVKDEGKKNSIGERVHQWVDVVSVKGFLDLASGDTIANNFNARIQESTHTFSFVIGLTVMHWELHQKTQELSLKVRYIVFRLLMTQWEEISILKYI